MEYTSIFEPLLIIWLSICLGLLIGSLATLYVSAKDHRAINKELDAKNKELQEWIDKWKNIYDDE